MLQKRTVQLVFLTRSSFRLEHGSRWWSMLTVILQIEIEIEIDLNLYFTSFLSVAYCKASVAVVSGIGRESGPLLAEQKGGFSTSAVASLAPLAFRIQYLLYRFKKVSQRKKYPSRSEGRSRFSWQTRSKRRRTLPLPS